MQNMFVWQIKTAQWTRDVVTDANTAGSRSVSVSAWLKKVRTLAIYDPRKLLIKKIMFNESVSLCVHVCVCVSAWMSLQ